MNDERVSLWMGPLGLGIVACLGPIGFVAFLFGFPIWLIATGFVIGTKARRSAKAVPAGLVASNLA